jgi:glycine cleavage system aminomethyltransferase T
MRRYGNDIDETINPIEAGLERYVSLKEDFKGKRNNTKPCGFPSSAFLLL